MKAKGIAKDLFGTYDNYVIPVQDLNQKNNLLNSFLWLEKNTDKIKITLNDKIKEYSELKEEYSKGLING